MALSAASKGLAYRVGGRPHVAEFTKQERQTCGLCLKDHVLLHNGKASVTLRRYRLHTEATESKASKSAQARWRCRAASDESSSPLASTSEEKAGAARQASLLPAHERTEAEAPCTSRDAEAAALECLDASSSEIDSGNGVQYDLQKLQALEFWLLSQGLIQPAQEIGQNGISSSRDVATGGVGSSGTGVADTDGSWWSRLNNAFSPRVRGLFLLNLLTLLYGSNISVIKEAEEAMDPAAFSAGRFIIAALVFLPVLNKALKDKSVRNAGLELGFWGALGYLSQAIGVTSTDAGRASFISTFTVIEVPIIAGLFGAKIPKVTWFSAAAAICGVGLLETTGGHSSVTGDIWTLLSAFFFGVHMLRSEHHSKELALQPALPLIGLQLATMATISATWALGAQVAAGNWGVLQPALDGDWSVVASSFSDVPWLPMVYTGLMSTALCLWIEVVSLRDVSATEAAMVYTLEPLYGAGFAWVLLGERWGLKGWMGAALILGGSLAMQLLGKIPEEEKEQQHEAKQLEVAKKPTSKAAAAALAAIAVAMALAAAATPRGSFAADDAAQQAALLADSVDLDNFATLLRIYALTKVDAEKEEWTGGAGMGD